MKSKNLKYGISCLLAVIALAGDALGVTYSFKDIFGDGSPSNVAIGMSQLFVDVADAGNSHVRFTFRNAGPTASSITRIYFEEGSQPPLDVLSSIENGDDVSFSQDSSNNLSGPPGGTNIGWKNKFTEFKADADAPVAPNGVGPGEYVSLLFGLSTNYSLADVLADLDANSWRIALHVQAFPNGASDSFVIDKRVPETPSVPVPEPMHTGSALGAALILLGLMQRWSRSGNLVR